MGGRSGGAALAGVCVRGRQAALGQRGVPGGEGPGRRARRRLGRPEAQAQAQTVRLCACTL